MGLLISFTSTDETITNVIKDNMQIVICKYFNFTISGLVLSLALENKTLRSGNLFLWYNGDPAQHEKRTLNRIESTSNKTFAR